jgi:hypothetical protein
MPEINEAAAAGELEKLAADINELHRQIEAAADDRRLELAFKLVEAEKLAGEGWEDWAAKSLDLSSSYLKEMLVIGKTPDPKAALEAHRKKTREKVAAHRTKLRNGGAEDDTHITILLPKTLQECRTKHDLMSRLDIRREKGRWLICIEKPAAEGAKTAEAA